MSSGRRDASRIDEVVDLVNAGLRIALGDEGQQRIARQYARSTLDELLRDMVRNNSRTEPADSKIVS
jgi:hypothetical protein